MGLFNFFKKGNKRFSSRVSLQTKELLVSSWNECEELLRLGKPSQVRQAVIKADEIIDRYLKELYPGLPKGVERYKKAESFFMDKQDYNDLWFAHKVRNELVHSLDFDLPFAQAKDVMEKYRKSLNILGVIDR